MTYLFTNEKEIIKEFKKVKKGKYQFSKWRTNTIDKIRKEKYSIEQLKDNKKYYKMNDINTDETFYLTEHAGRLIPIFLLLLPLMYFIYGNYGKSVGSISQEDLTIRVALIATLIIIFPIILYTLTSSIDSYMNRIKVMKYFYNKEMIDIIDELILNH